MSCGAFPQYRSSWFNGLLTLHLYGHADWWYSAVPPPTTVAPQLNILHHGLTKQPPLIRQNLAYKVRNCCETLMELSYYEWQGSMAPAAILPSGSEQDE